MTPDDRKIFRHDHSLRALCSEMPETSDREALSLLRLHQPRGFDLVYERYAERIFGFLVRLSGSRAVAQDLFQHTFLRLAEVGPSLRPDSDLRAWLFSVARNAFLSHVRARGAQARTDHELACLRSSVGTAATEAGLALSELERALGTLQPEARELLLLIGVEGLSFAELAEVMQVEAGTLRKRVSRARERLAQALDGEPRSVSKLERSE